MASGSSNRVNNPGSKGFDFASDDILCSYDDFANQDNNNNNANGNHSDPVIASNSAKEFNKNRMTRTSMFPSSAYSPPEESSVHQDVSAIVDKTVKKYSDNLMRFLEGISSRLSQLELYCYKLDKSIGEMHSDLVRDHGEAETKLKNLDKNLQEVHRNVQILRDKQELVEAQRELAKLQVVQKESSGSSSQENEERAKQAASDAKRNDNTCEAPEHQLALALPHQIPPQQQQQQTVQAPPSIPSQGITQSPGYYLPQPQMPQAPNQLSQSQYMPSDSQYRTSQAQDFARLPPQPVQPQLNQTPQTQPVSPYQQQWAPQLPPQVQQQQQLPQQVQQQPQQVQQQPQQPPPSMQQQARPSSPAIYSSYLPNQSNPTPEMVPNNVSMQVPYSGISQTVASRPEGMSYGYGGPGRPVQPQAPAQHMRPTFGATGDGYGVSAPHPSLAPGNTYVMYDGEGGRTHPPHQPHFSHGGYPPSSFPMQNQPPAASTNVMARTPQMARNIPYNDLIEKLVNMGYRGDHVVGVIQSLEESGQPVDFNAILDRLNDHSSGGSQSRW